MLFRALWPKEPVADASCLGWEYPVTGVRKGCKKRKSAGTPEPDQIEAAGVWLAMGSAHVKVVS